MVVAVSCGMVNRWEVWFSVLCLGAFALNALEKIGRADLRGLESLFA